jgi:tRNA A-37 threonylcarbamoyl transferase component Bud32
MTETSPSIDGRGSAAGGVREVTVNGMRWAVREEVAEFLVEAGALDVWKLAEHPSARLVRKSPRRMVFEASLPRARAPALEIVVRIFLRPRLRDLMRDLVRQGRGMKEWNAGLELERRGIATVRCLAAGTRRAAGVLREDAIIMEAKSDATPLDRFVTEELSKLDGAEHGRALRRGATGLARFFRRLHDRGVAHRHLHAHNLFLVKDAMSEAGWTAMTDLAVENRRRPLALGARIANLTQLNRFFLGAVSRTTRLRFWKEYVRGIPFLEEHRDAYARLVEEHTVRARERLWSRRDRYCVGTNRGFRRFRLGRMRGHTVRELMRLEPEVLAGIPERGRVMPDAVLLKESGGTRVWEQRIDFGPESCTIVVKDERREWGLRLFRTFFRRVGATSEWRSAHALLARGIPAAEPLSAMESRTLGCLRESVLVTRKVENAGNLAEFVRLTFTKDASAETRRLGRRLARSLGRLVRRLHERGFTQRDLKPANILVSRGEGAKAGEMHFTLVDFKGIRHRKTVSEGERARDIARLAAGFVTEEAGDVRATDRMRFLDEYLSGSGMAEWRRREFMAEIEERIQEKLRCWEAGRKGE